MRVIRMCYILNELSCQYVLVSENSEFLSESNLILHNAPSDPSWLDAKRLASPITGVQFRSYVCFCYFKHRWS